MRRVMVLLGCLLVLSNLASAEVKIAFEPDAAVATGITPGGDAVWFGVSRDREEWSDHFFHWRLTTDDGDTNGTVSFPHEKRFPALTVLVVVDLVNGEYAIGTAYPRETPIPPLDLSGAQAGPTGMLTGFTQQGTHVDVFVARAGAGAWSASIADGGPLDQDGVADGVVTIGFAALRPAAGKTARLDGVRAGDIVALGDVTGPWVRVTKVGGTGGEE